MKKLLVISGKGGTGKTTVSSALIHLLHARAMADCDVDAPNLHLIESFNTPPRATEYCGADRAFVDADRCVGCGECQSHCRFDAIKVAGGVAMVSAIACEGCGVCMLICPAEAVTLSPDVSGTCYLYQDSDGSEKSRTFSSAELKIGRGNSGKLVATVKEQLDKDAGDVPLAIYDGSPGVGCPVMASVSGMDGVLIVTEPTASGKSDLLRLLGMLKLAAARPFAVVNKFDLNPQKAAEIKALCEKEGIAFLGNIPYDEEAPQAVNRGVPLSTLHTPAAAALTALAPRVAELLGVAHEN